MTVTQGIKSPHLAAALAILVAVCTALFGPDAYYVFACADALKALIPTKSSTTITVAP